MNNEIELLGPPDEEGNRSPIRTWYGRKIGKPYERYDAGGDPYICVNMYSSVIERDLDLGAYDTPILTSADNKAILDYYGKPSISGSPVVGVTQVYFPTRRLSNPVVQYTVLR